MFAAVQLQWNENATYLKQFSYLITYALTRFNNFFVILSIIQGPNQFSSILEPPVYQNQIQFI